MRRLAIHVVLFLLTAASTFFVAGLAYSLSIMSILLAHEMGHYFMSRKYGIPATLPYFIPFPFSPFGTFGAIIKMKGVIINKKALFDIGVAGPLSGFVVSVPFIILGIKLSKVMSLGGLTGSASYFQLGDSLLFRIVQWVFFGDIPKGFDLVLHPFAYAGWVGLFVTALNLLPVGQLDGGHIIYAVFGEKSKWVFGTTIAALGVVAIFYNPGWLLLVILLLIFGMRHPRPIDIETKLDSGRKLVAFVILIIFLLSFVPAPFPFLNIDLRKSIGIPI
jgi:membrane-associated protease RseP (regulator of RpoE activity)